MRILFCIVCIFAPLVTTAGTAQIYAYAVANGYSGNVSDLRKHITLVDDGNGQRIAEWNVPGVAKPTGNFEQTEAECGRLLAIPATHRKVVAGKLVEKSDAEKAVVDAEEVTQEVSSDAKFMALVEAVNDALKSLKTGGQGAQDAPIITVEKIVEKIKAKKGK